MLEFPILKQYHDHPFLQVNTRDRGEEKGDEGGEGYAGITSTLSNRKEQRKNDKQARVAKKKEDLTPNEGRFKA